MELVPIKTVHGEDKSWRVLAEMDPDEVCQSARVRYDRDTKTYTVNCFGIKFQVNVSERSIWTEDARGKLFLEKLKDFFRLSILWYLTSAKDIPCTERLVRPTDIRGGQRFTMGTHVLPTEQIAQRFARDSDGFTDQALTYGGEVIEFGDAAVRLYPLPRVPVTLILRTEDEDFPPRVDLLFDSSCNFQLDLSDIVWAVAMMSSLVMLEQLKV